MELADDLLALSEAQLPEEAQAADQLPRVEADAGAGFLAAVAQSRQATPRAAGKLVQLEPHPEQEGHAEPQDDDRHDRAQQQGVGVPGVDDQQAYAREPEVDRGGEGEHRVEQRQGAEDSEDPLLAVEALPRLDLPPHLALN